MAGVLRAMWRHHVLNVVEVASQIPGRCFGGQTALLPSRSVEKHGLFGPVSRFHASTIRNADQPQPRHSKSKDQTTKRKESRSTLAKTSLRRTAAEAERSRNGSKFLGQDNEKLDRGLETRDVTAFCAAEQYDIGKVSQILQNVGYRIDPCETNLVSQVVHIQILSSLSGLGTPNGDLATLGDLFIFPSGTLVAWDIDSDAVMRLISTALQPAAINPYTSDIETEDLEYYEDPESEKSRVTGDLIKLGTRPNSIIRAEELASLEANEGQDANDTLAKLHQANIVLAKIAFSSGLARSTKLAVLEASLERYFKSTRDIPTKLSQGAKLPFTRPFILQKTGELLSVRAQLNLYSELTDSLPDLFWDSRHELGLENYYEQLGKALDTNVRIKILNERMDYAQEIAAVLRERLSERHGEILEWSIIILISIEVFFEILRLYRES